MSLEMSTLRLSEARLHGDADDIAEALALHADDLLRNGRTREASLELDEAAAIHCSRGRVYDEARCTQLAATLCRFEGRLEDAKERARRALTLSEFKGPIAVSAHAELGEIAMAEGKGDEAASAYRAAFDEGEATGLVGSGCAALLRKRAAALATGARYPEAIHDLDSARDILNRAGDRAGALRALIEKATVLQHAGRFTESGQVARGALDPAREAGNQAALADLHLLLAAEALNRRDGMAAMSAAQTARAYALAANTPTSYIGAAITIAEIAESAGDRQKAYETLAAGWATLADLLGRDLAKMAFEPKLKGMRERWGVVAFDDVKKAYETNRRQARTSK